MKFLIIGGAGYIGSHMVKQLYEAGHSVVTFDNLSNGYRDSVLYGDFFEGDLASKRDLEQVFSEYSFDQVMHFASFIETSESIMRPDLYYRNNVTNTINLLDVMVKHNVLNLIFSSTASLFGTPEYTPIDEKHPIKAISPYGTSKHMVEQILDDYDIAFGLKSICLRYFNASGADPDGMIGERHNPESHLIPLILQAASSRRKNIKVFGTDYDTEDGTCVRDYIHVVDLCNAHLCASVKLDESNLSAKYNLGNGSGFSVRELITVAEEVVGKDYLISVVDAERRLGDPAVLVADANLAKKELDWAPKYTDIKQIIEHAWNWELKLLNK